MDAAVREEPREEPQGDAAATVPAGVGGPGAVAGSGRTVVESWLDVLWQVARHYGLDASKERVKVDVNWLAGDVPLDVLIDRMARQMGLSVVFDQFSEAMLDPWRLPLVADLGEGGVAVIEQAGSDGRVSLRLSGDGGLVTQVALADLEPRLRRVLLAKPVGSVPDARVDEYIKPYQPDWFWSLVLKEWPRYGDVMLASLVANVLTLAAMLFTMQVYDRVIPAQSEPTLWVLYGGMLVALTFAFVMRVLRTKVSDMVGKRADLRISDRVFGHALRIRSEARVESTGSFISQLRELEQVRELVTSTTVAALADLPFFLLFLFVMWWISGSPALMAVPLGFIVLLVVPGVLVQPVLARLSKEGMREGALRNAMLVEAVQGIDDIKTLRAESRFQNQWNHVNAVMSTIGMKQRMVTSLLTNWTQEVQTLVYATVVLVGSYKVMSGDMSMGVLVASSMLASRMVAPLGQVTAILARWQSAKVARDGLNQLMQKPVDHPEQERRVHRAVLRGEYSLSGVTFRYGGNVPRPTLDIAKLDIRAGERLALLGRNGAGKSTLLQILSGLYRPADGAVLLDKLRLSDIDPTDVRRDVVLLSQTANLFHGSIRDNLTLGLPHARDEDILRALDLTGALAYINALPDGLEHMILEGGRGLSGGQKQMLLLARTVIREPHVLLLDEPTAWMDDVSERALIDKMGPWLAQRTLVVCTHRPAVLQWVDRVVVLDQGRVALDGPKARVLSRRAAPVPVVEPAQVAREEQSDKGASA